MENYIRYDFHKIRDLKISNFNFDVINDINWRQLNESMVKLQTNNIIKGMNIRKKIVNYSIKYLITGDMVIYSNVAIKNLITKKVLDKNASELFTTTTDQIITADMQLMDINVKNVICSSINGLSLNESAATFKNNNISGIFQISFPAVFTYFQNKILGPVTINKMHVSGIVNGLHFPVDKFKDTVKIHDYIGHVKIKGSLTLTNVSLNDITELKYKNKIIPPNYIDEFWLKNKNQVQKSITLKNIL